VEYLETQNPLLAEKQAKSSQGREAKGDVFQRSHITIPR
jgi:hypothetical protein